MASNPIVPVANALRNLNLFLGRPSAAFDKVLSILGGTGAVLDGTGQEGSLPPLLREVGLPAIRGWYYGKEAIDDGKMPALVLTAAVGQEPMGMGIKLTTNLQLHCLVPAIAKRKQVRDCLDTLGCVKAVLWEFRGAYWERDETNGRNQIFWHSLMPDVDTMVPADWKQYDGWTAHFRMEQAPNSQLWPPASP